jgi:phage-related protein
MTQKIPRNITIYKNYFWEFYNQQPVKVQQKIEWVIDLVKTLAVIPKTYFDTIGDGIFEIRIEYQGNIYRIFCFFDEGNLVIVLNGFQKKTPKTPKSEIERAKTIRAEYYAEKRRVNQAKKDKK